MTEIVTEVMVLPEGMDIDDDARSVFAVFVRWRGPRGDTGRGGYAVMHTNDHLSKRGDWRDNPEPFLQRHYRWETLEEALAAARKVVNTVRMMGMTFPEWQARHLARIAEAES